MDSHIKWARKELGIQQGPRRTESTSNTPLRLQAPLRSRRLGGVGLFVTVRARYHHLILLPPFSKVAGCSRLDTRSPEGALVVYDAGWVGAGWARVLRRVSLVKDVESRAKRCVVAPLGATECVIALEGLKSKVGICGDAGVKVLEGLLIAKWGYSVYSRPTIKGKVQKSHDVIDRG